MMTIPESSARTTHARSNTQICCVVTYNIRAGIGMDEHYSLDQVAEALASYQADLIGLQEVDVCWGERSHYDNQVMELARRLNMHSFFAPIYSLDPLEPGRGRRHYGLAILSRYPFTAMINHSMTRLSTQVPNPAPAPAPGFADVQINVNGTNLRVLNIQLDYRSDPAVRQMQVYDILSATANLQAPAVLLGDFNALPGAPELAPLAQTWKDAWEVRGEGPGETFPADIPAKRIDRIMMTPDIHVEEIRVATTLASDHRPVIAKLVV